MFLPSALVGLFYKFMFKLTCVKQLIKNLSKDKYINYFHVITFAVQVLEAIKIHA